MPPLLIGVDGGSRRPARDRAQARPHHRRHGLGVASGPCAAAPTLVVHGYKDGRAPGSERLDELGLEHVVFASAGTSEDIAMLLAFEKGAELIVAVGTHNSMVEFLDKGRAGMASTFLVRMKVGPILVDAKGVSRLYHHRVRKRDLALLVAVRRRSPSSSSPSSASRCASSCAATGSPSPPRPPVINLRYHIVSITAVFLALGIGLTLGSTFLDRVTVDNLNNQLSDVSTQVGETRRQIEDLRGQVEQSAKRDAELASELPEQLLAGHLDGVPLLVIATRGTDENLVNQTRAALASAGGQVAGTWWLTDRWSLTERSDTDDLSGVLDLTTDDVDRLQRNSAIRLADLLAGASNPAPVEGADDAQPTPNEPPLVASLVQAGFIDYEAMPGAADPRVLLPGAAARYVVISGIAADAGSNTFAVGLAEQLASEDTISTVAAQGLTVLPDGKSGPASEDERRSTFLGPLRAGEVAKARVSTVDDLDLAAGQAALVLALEDLGTGQVGHYGVGPGAGRLLPPPVAAP